MNPNAFSPTLVGYAQSSILGVADMGAIMPDFQDKLYNQFGDQYTKEFRLWMAMQGMMKPAHNPEGGFLFEEERYDEFITVLANAGTSGSTLVFTLDPGEVETLNGLPYIYPRVNDTIFDPEYMTRGVVISITYAGIVPTITVESLDNANWVAPSAGKVYAIYGNAFQENSDGPNSRQSFWTKKTYKHQIMREAATATDLALSAELFPQTDQFGRFVGNWGGVVRTQMEMRMYKYLFGTVWLGQNNSNTGSVPQSTTTGYFQEFSTASNGVDVGPDNYPVHFQDLADSLYENSPMSANYIGYIGRNLQAPITTSMQSYFKDANIVQVREQTSKYMFGNDATEGMLARFDFHTFIVNGMTFSIRVNKPTYDPKMLGVTPSLNYFDNTGYFIPSEQGTDGEGKATRNVQLRYLTIPGINQGGDRKIAMWDTGALAPVPTNRQLNHTMDCVSWFGNQFFNIAQTGYFFKSVGS